MGVDLFFVLSGFLIGTQVLKPFARGAQVSFTDFYVRRAFRILPAYWVVLAIYVLVPDFRETQGMEPWWKFAAFVVNLNIDYVKSAAFSHAWSLSVEEHFYLIFPLLAALLMRKPSTLRFAALCTILVLAGAALRTLAFLHNTATDPDMVRNWFVEDIYYPTWNRLDGLLCGVALAAWKVLRPEAWARAKRYSNVFFLAGLIVMALALWLFQNRVGLLANVLGWPVLSFGLGLLVLAAADHESLVGRWKVPGAEWLAAISYSLYLVHKAIYHVVQVQWGDRLEGSAAFLAYGLAALTAGAVLHYAVERPSLRLRGRLSLRWLGKTAPAST